MANLKSRYLEWPRINVNTSNYNYNYPSTPMLESKKYWATEKMFVDTNSTFTLAAS